MSTERGGFTGARGPVGLKVYSLLLQAAAVASGVWIGVVTFRWITG